MSLKLGTTDISGVPATLISTVNNKLDASTYTSNPRTNAMYITEFNSEGEGWWRVWSNGWCEQYITMLTTGSVTTVNFYKTMNTGFYSVLVTQAMSATPTYNANFYVVETQKTPSSVQIMTSNTNNSNRVNVYIAGYKY